MARETAGPSRWRISARTLDHYRTRVYSGRTLTQEETNDILPGSSGPTSPDKNPPMPPNPPSPDAS